MPVWRRQISDDLRGPMCRICDAREQLILGFNNLRYARILLIGIDLMDMITKSQLQDRGLGYTQVQQFYFLAASAILLILPFVRHLLTAKKPTFESPLKSL
jgi:hypothetical protein